MILHNPSEDIFSLLYLMYRFYFFFSHRKGSWKISIVSEGPDIFLSQGFFQILCKCSQLEESVCMLPDGHSIAGCIFCDIPADRCSYFSVVTPVSQCFRHVTLSSPTVIKIKMCHRQLSIELTSAIHWFFHSWPLVLVYYSCSSHEFSLSFVPFWRT